MPAAISGERGCPVFLRRHSLPVREGIDPELLSTSIGESQRDPSSNGTRTSFRPLEKGRRIIECFAAFGLLAQLRQDLPDVERPAADMLAFLYRYIAIILLLNLCVFAGWWGVLVKAGEPGWASLVPIYNLVVLFRIAGMPAWYVAVMFIPFLGAIASVVLLIMVDIELSNRFNMGGGFTVGLILLPFIFYPILGFGSAEYEDGIRRAITKKRRQPGGRPMRRSRIQRPAGN
jgi:hypothetical protein